MNLKARGAVLGAAAFASLAAALILFPAPGNPKPRAWALSLTIQAEGAYRVTVTNATYDGDFAFTLAWLGTMEEDDDDYRLVQREITLLDWRAGETASLSGGRTLKTTADFPAPPALRHFYVLKDKGFFNIDFALPGFAVPVHDSEEKAVLDMPRAAKNRVPESGADYDAHVRRGSNVLRLPAASISEKSLERTFHWTWERKNKPLRGGQAGLLSARHSVRAVVRLRPVRPERP